jgi:ABC-type amino acid transport substrate-binding protein
MTDSAPFSFKIDKGFDGLALRLWQQVALINKWNHYEFIEASGNVEEAIRSLNSGRFEVLLGPVSINYKNLKSANFSIGYFINRLSLVTPKKPHDFWTLFSQSLNEGFVGMTQFSIFAFLLLAHLVWLNEKTLYLRAMSYKNGISKVLWSFLMVLGTIDMPYEPRHTLSKIFMIIWMITAICFTTAFTGIVSSAFTVSSVHQSSAEIQDLRGKKFIYIEGNIAKSFMSSFHKVYDAQWIPVQTIDEAFELLLKGKAEGILEDYIMAKTYMENHHIDNLKIDILSFSRDLFGVAFVKGSSYLEPFNNALLKMRNEGISQAMCMRQLNMSERDLCVL